MGIPDLYRLDHQLEQLSEGNFGNGAMCFEVDDADCLVTSNL